jgi:hypothetical protein
MTIKYKIQGIEGVLIKNIVPTDEYSGECVQIEKHLYKRRFT